MSIPLCISGSLAAWRDQILNDPDTRQFFATAVPSEPLPGTPASLVAYPKEDIPRWAKAYRLSKIELQRWYAWPSRASVAARSRAACDPERFQPPAERLRLFGKQAPGLPHRRFDVIGLPRRDRGRKP